ncbi:MAG: glycerate kinase [Synergistaceae bacterium]|nr:glycerate kinase [Synergistaceae bacterium]
MKIVAAIDSFKGSMSSVEAASRVEIGIKRARPDAEVVKIPIADGGEGTVLALTAGTGWTTCAQTVTGPLGLPVEAVYGVLRGGVAVIEMAAAAGLPLVPEDKRNPSLTTTRGVGELILAALDRGCGKIVLGIGGSATNDGGAGMAQALGVSFRDENGRELGGGGGALSALASIDTSGLDRRIRDCEIVIASDVRNPLCGKFGASAVYGPQKGACPDMARELDRNLAHLAEVTKSQLGADMADVSGAGAAGGLGYGLMAYCGAVIGSGIDTVLDIVDFDGHMANCSLVITGEGKIDAQSAYGKAPVGVARRAKKFGAPVIAIAGGIGTGAEAVYNEGIDAMISIVNGAMTLEDAMKNCGPLLEDAAERIMRMINIGLSMGRGKI